MNIIPMSDRVLLKWLEAEKVTATWIYIPESANKERPYAYEVVAVWPWKEVNWIIQKIDLKPGDKIISGQYSWDDIEVKWMKYKILAADYILAKIEE